MATDFWASSHLSDIPSVVSTPALTIIHCNLATFRQARADDLRYVDDPEHLDFLAIFFANLISKLGKKLQLRQRVIATATVFFRRFYIKNSYCETDPFIVIAACCYVAAKAEELPVHIKNVVSEARQIFGSEEYGVKSFPTDNSKLAEMEFYLVDDLECDLIVFHPYRTLMMLCGKEGSIHVSEAEAGEVGAGIDDGRRFWGTGEGKLELQDGALQMAWWVSPRSLTAHASEQQAAARFIINDTYRTDLCLIHPPHLIAIAAIYLVLVLHNSTRSLIQAQSSSSSSQSVSRSSSHSQLQSQPSTATTPRRSSRSNAAAHRKQPQDIVGFMAGLNVSMAHVATIAQEIIGLYALWDRYREDGTAGSGDSARGVFAQHRPGYSGAKRAAGGESVGRSGSVGSGGTMSSGATPVTSESAEQGQQVVDAGFLIQVLLRMREGRFADMAHPPSGRPVAVNKRLERAQAAG
ncbi:predicted protein [Postia placenta Mad-698-R]|nr:predicted protein [Postia placenta Mad-698-R]